MVWIRAYFLEEYGAGRSAPVADSCFAWRREDQACVAEQLQGVQHRVRPTPYSCWRALTDGSGPVRHCPASIRRVKMPASC